MTTSLLAIVTILGVDAGAAKPTPSFPCELVGTWDVEHVAVDRQDLATRWHFRPDSPRLVGRTLVIDSDEVKFERGKDFSCKPSTAKAHTTTWGFLFAKGFPRPETGGRSPRPSPADYGLKVAKTQPVTAYSLCSSSRPNANAFPMDHWAALQTPDRLAFNLDAQTLLLFRRRPPTAKPSASFDCTKATTQTEKAICSSFDLASWDRSVALAWRQALKSQSDDQAELQKSQKEWLHSRDDCGDKPDCIYELQRRRVEELTQQ